jgi:hypothetical protein
LIALEIPDFVCTVHVAATRKCKQRCQSSPIWTTSRRSLTPERPPGEEMGRLHTKGSVPITCIVVMLSWGTPYSGSLPLLSALESDRQLDDAHVLVQWRVLNLGNRRGQLQIRELLAKVCY